MMVPTAHSQGGEWRSQKKKGNKGEHTSNFPKVTELVLLKGSGDIWFPGVKLFAGAGDKQKEQFNILWVLPRGYRDGGETN